MGLELKVKGSSINASELKEGEVAVVVSSKCDCFKVGSIVHVIAIMAPWNREGLNSPFINKYFLVDIGSISSAIELFLINKGELIVRVLQKGEEIVIK